MKTNMLAMATALSDAELLTRIETLARTERQSTAELVGHLAVLETRPSAYAALGYGSLFNYCVEGLHLSEDAASTRIAVARLCRRYPRLLRMLGSGELSLTAARTLGPHLTEENHEAVLSRAAHQRREGIEMLVARMSPQADVKTTIRRLPSPVVVLEPETVEERTLFADPDVLPAIERAGPQTSVTVIEAVPEAGGTLGAHVGVSVCVPRKPEKATMKALSPERYRVQFTIGQDTHDAVKRLQALMRRENPGGDVAAIFEQAVQLLLEKVEKAKLGRTKNTAAPAKMKAGRSTYENRIRFETGDRPGRSRHVPSAVKRAVWWRDGARCAFVSAKGVRCAERSFLELHHIHPYAQDGTTTTDNVSLRCRRHNQYEAEIVFGKWTAPSRK